MKYDPILTEVHKAKDAVAKEAGYDIHKLCAMLRAKEALHPERMAKIKPTPYPRKRDKPEVAKNKGLRPSTQ